MDNKSPRTRWVDAVKKSSLPPSVRHVLHVMSTYSDEKAKPVYPSQEKIGQDTGHNRETVSRLIKKAVQAGFLVCEEAGGPGKSRKSNLYSLHIPVTSNVTNDHMNNTSYSSSFTNYKDVRVTRDHREEMISTNQNDSLDEFSVIDDHINSLEDSKERISSNDSFTTLEDVHVTDDHSHPLYAQQISNRDAFESIRNIVERYVQLPDGVDAWTDDLICKAYDFSMTVEGTYMDAFSRLTKEEQCLIRENFYLSSGITAKEYARHVLPI